ncbi:hypothetical protein TNIN_225731 [Trichonephila inaurata madagascariensis]|uniref:Uncharacterized protein n=1 Tax=Trichonephila inaurata madagascariensis TaxID=2747483 RepID=A0A8X7C018_9ARAC|nr:hypothetical protein TNIN_225731 [Trichonephila inaurata madagascariensis]
MPAPYNWPSRLSFCSCISFLLDLEAILASFTRSDSDLSASFMRCLSISRHISLLFGPISKFIAFIICKIEEDPSLNTQTETQKYREKRAFVD